MPVQAFKSTFQDVATTMKTLTELVPIMAGKQPARSPLSPDRATIERFLGFCHRHRYPNRTEIFRPGDLADTMYYVISGSLSIVSEEPDGRELVLGYINAGEFIGELGLFILAEKREVVLRSRSPCEMAEISYERLNQLFVHELALECPRILYAIGAQISKRLLDTSRKASRLAFMDVTSRIARTLLDLCQEPDAMTHPQGTQIKISRQELARIVGCSREMAGRVLKNLQEQGLLYARGKTVVIFGTR